MTTKDFTTSFTVKQSPEEVFKAATNVRGWWSESVEGSSDALGAEFVYHYKDFHRSTQKVTEFVPGKRLVWHVSQAQLNFVQNKREWTGTDIVFEIAPNNGGTELRFTHKGLVPALQCYPGCSGAWGTYVGESLRSLIENDKGNPDGKEL
jgi:uncharacterized protein YndB with AHSA1/START domain